MQPVLDYLAANEARFLRELCDYLRFPSVSAQPKHKPDLERCAAWIADHARGLGLDVEVCPTAGNPIVLVRTPRKAGARRPHYVVYGHYDVQPPDPLEAWETPPFEPTIKDGRIHARGASDDKSPLWIQFSKIQPKL
mgnify:CR=1 FL=1